MKRLLFTLVLLAALWQARGSVATGDIISTYEHFAPAQLLDTADYYYINGYMDTALVCYNLLINSPAPDMDTAQQRRIVEAYNKAAIIHFHLGAYRNSYELLLQALPLAEKCNYTAYEPKIYTNIGNIYYRFYEYDMAMQYYSKALDLCRDSTAIVILFNNMGAIEAAKGKTDSAFYYLNESLQVSNRHGRIYLHSILNTIASLCQKGKQYDSAAHYYRLALHEVEGKNKPEEEADNLSDLGNLFFEINQMDSARFYIALSNAVAAEHNIGRTLVENYLILSKIEKSSGRSPQALAYFEKYAGLKDSIFNAKNFGDINQLQRLYEMSKANRQIEALTIEQQIKGRTIYYQNIIQYIILSVLVLVCSVLAYIFYQKKKLNRLYKTLVKKNLEIIEFQENTPEKGPKKYKSTPPPHDTQDELLDKILAAMEDTTVICDPKFSINMLAGLVQANHIYVSQIINNVLQKNFRSFLNSYRIREAQRLFSEPDAAKYTIEAVSLRVGFKSRSTFREAFKDITGVSPNFYLKTMQENAEREKPKN